MPPVWPYIQCAVPTCINVHRHSAYKHATTTLTACSTSSMSQAVISRASLQVSTRLRSAAAAAAAAAVAVPVCERSLHSRFRFGDSDRSGLHPQCRPVSTDIAIKSVSLLNRLVALQLNRYNTVQYIYNVCHKPQPHNQ